MEFYSEEIVVNIKLEEPGIETKEFGIYLQKFIFGKKKGLKVFDSFFVCRKCDYVTPYSSYLKRHDSNCEGKKCFQCSLCDLGFSNRQEKAKHELDYHRVGSVWQCLKCPFNSPIRRLLSYHNHRMHSKPFQCETCNESYQTRKQLKEHQTDHRHGVYQKLPIEKFACVECDKIFTSKKRLYEHKRKVHKKADLQCDICSKMFKTKKILKKHLETHFKIPCTVCRQTFTKHLLKIHMEEDHPELSDKGNALQCDHCGKQLMTMRRMRLHLRSHIRIPCKICGRATYENNLYRHMRRFHRKGSSLLACGILQCHQRFSSMKDLKEHQKIHLGPGRYQCPKCNYSAKTLGNITNHMKRC